MTQDENWEEFDFIRFTWCDTNGVPRGKVVPRNSYRSFQKSGVGMNSLYAIFGIDSKPPIIPHIIARGSPNNNLIPVIETWHSCPWSGNGKSKVAQVLCQMHELGKDSKPNSFDSRGICVKLLNHLKTEFGLELYSALEYEFVLTKDKNPLGIAGHSCSAFNLKKTEDICFEITKRLQEAGVSIESIHSEAFDGQIEMTMQPKYGIGSADDACLHKDCVKSTAFEYGYEATYICCPSEGVFNGGHFNFSLWKDGQNALTDGSDQVALSELAKYWISGIMEHAAGITALICPNNNSYRRFCGVASAQAEICYSRESRSAMLRIKETSDVQTYLEFRSPGASANPYLVLSAVLAAGMDGLRQQRLPQPIGINKERHLPGSLFEALDAFEADDVVKEALGEDFSQMYLDLKRQKDLPIKNLQQQREMYSYLL